MRILIISQYFWPENFPINDVAKGLKDRGHEISVLTGMPNYPAGRFFKGYNAFSIRKENCDGIRVVRVPMVPKGSGSGLHMMLYYLSLAISGSFLVPIFFCRKIDLVFVYQPSPITVGLPALVLKWFEHLPVFIWIQDIWPETLAATGMVQSKVALKLVRELVRFIYSNCDRVLVSSRAFVKRVNELGVPLDKIFYLPNTAGSMYKPVSIDKGSPVRSTIPEGFRILFAGNIGKAQDLPTILSAAELLKTQKEIQWILIGDGTMRSWAETKRNNLQLKDTVHFLGRYPPEKMPQFFSLADVLLVTLRDEFIFYLTVPSKVQAYLACGRPIIAALEGEGARILRESGAGIIVTPGNARALAQAVLEMHEMSIEDREQMGYLGRKYFEAHFERNMLLDRVDVWLKEGVEKCDY